MEDEEKHPKPPTGVVLLGEACTGKSTFLDKLMFLTEQKAVLSPSYKLELSSAVGLRQSPEERIDVNTKSDEPFFVQALRQSLTDEAKQRCEIQYLTPEKHISEEELKEDDQACFDTYREFHQSGRLEETRGFLLPCSDYTESSPLTTMVTKLRHGLVVHAVAKYMDEAQLKTKLFQHVQHLRQKVEEPGCLVMFNLVPHGEQKSTHQAWVMFTVGKDGQGQDITAVNQPADIVLTDSVRQLVGQVKIVTGCGQIPRQDQIFVRNWLIQVNQDKKWAFCLDFVDVHFNSSLLSAGLFFVDIPGTNNSRKHAYTTTLTAMREANVVMLLMDRPSLKKSDCDMLRAADFLRQKLLLKDQTQRTGLIVSYMPSSVKVDKAIHMVKTASEYLLDETERIAKYMDPTTVLPNFQQLFKIRATRNAPDSDELAAPPNKRRRTDAGAKTDAPGSIPEHLSVAQISEPPPNPVYVQHKGKTSVAYISASFIPFIATHLNLQQPRDQRDLTELPWLDDPLAVQVHQDATNMSKLLDIFKSFASK